MSSLSLESNPNFKPRSSYTDQHQQQQHAYGAQAQQYGMAAYGSQPSPYKSSGAREPEQGPYLPVQGQQFYAGQIQYHSILGQQFYTGQAPYTLTQGQRFHPAQGPYTPTTQQSNISVSSAESTQHPPSGVTQFPLSQSYFGPSQPPYVPQSSTYPSYSGYSQPGSYAIPSSRVLNSRRLADTIPDPEFQVKSNPKEFFTVGRVGQISPLC